MKKKEEKRGALKRKRKREVKIYKEEVKKYCFYDFKYYICGFS